MKLIYCRPEFLQHGPGILRWRYKSSGTYTVKEVYSLSTANQKEPHLINWRKVWNPNIWPKISTFLWLLSHRSILTWDNLLKPGFYGPSWCVLCNMYSEFIDHLLDSCSFTSLLWYKEAENRHRSRRVKGNITETLQQWDVKPFQG